VGSPIMLLVPPKIFQGDGVHIICCFRIFRQMKENLLNFIRIFSFVNQFKVKFIFLIVGFHKNVAIKPTLKLALVNISLFVDCKGSVWGGLFGIPCNWSYTWGHWWLLLIFVKKLKDQNNYILVVFMVS